MTIPIVVALAGLVAAGDTVVPSDTLTARATVTVVAPAPKGSVPKFAPDAAETARRPAAPTCAARIVTADPSVDAAMAVPAPPHLDARMAVRGRCLATAPRP